MIVRQYWMDRIRAAFKRRSLIWLIGVRRAGKTLLCKSLPGVEYFDCELPSVRKALADPEEFWRSRKAGYVALDEIHRLKDPAEVLKIATDHFPEIKVIATGSSSLGASSKFRDKLTGRKVDIWLTPMNESDRADFGGQSLEYRLERGGLPPFYLAGQFFEEEVQDWISSFWNKDIEELFRVERRGPFLRFFELLFAQSGGIFEATSLAAPSGVSRPTIQAYLNVLESALVAHVIRPFHTRKTNEIVLAPKVYGFDTGFVGCLQGWRDLRPSDYGMLWEHYVLNELISLEPRRSVFYWRDKQHHEVDFVLHRKGSDPIAIECKWSSSAFDPAALRPFRAKYPKGRNIVCCRDIERPYNRRFGDLTCEFVGLAGLATLTSPEEARAEAPPPPRSRRQPSAR